MHRHNIYYFTDYFNYLDIGTIVFPLLIIPFRATNLPVQWVFASLGYLCQSLRGFKFGAVFRYIFLSYLKHFCDLYFRSTGAYLQILFKIFINDMIPFIAIFSIFLFSFTGALYFALRGEEREEIITVVGNCTETDNQNCTHNTTIVTTRSNLDNFPHLTM